MKFDVLYADPPWDYKGQTQHGGKGTSDTGGAAKHYSTVTLADLKRLNVSDLAADNALMFMWSSSPHLDQALELMRAWQFEWLTVGFVWDKQRVNPGFYTMSQCEVCLIGRKGELLEPAQTTHQLVHELRGEHSAKPETVRKRIEQMFPTHHKLELFARSAVPHWSVWGNEVESDVVLTWR